MQIRSLLLLLLLISFNSCKTGISINKYPTKPEGIIISGRCLVNEIRTSIPMKHQEMLVEKMLSGLRQFIPQVHYAGYHKDIEKFGLPLDALAQPEILDKINNEFGFDYLIDFQATSIGTQIGWGITFGLYDFDHRVNVSISVYDTKSQQILYYQGIEVTEEWEESDDDYSEENRNGFFLDNFLITRTSENLLKIGIKKCTNGLKRRMVRKIKSDYSKLAIMERRSIFITDSASENR